MHRRHRHRLQVAGQRGLLDEAVLVTLRMRPAAVVEEEHPVLVGLRHGPPVRRRLRPAGVPQALAPRDRREVQDQLLHGGPTAGAEKGEEGSLLNFRVAFCIFRETSNLLFLGKL